MPEPATYEIVLRGQPSTRLLRPLLDDFTIDSATNGVTCLVGEICDPAHLHGVVAHLTSVTVEIISIAPRNSKPLLNNKTNNTKGIPMTFSAELPTLRTTGYAIAGSPHLLHAVSGTQGTRMAAEPTGRGGGAPRMQAITQRRYGGAGVLEVGFTSKPSPTADQVLIQVVAAGVDRGTCHLMTGTPYLIRIAGYGLTKPKNQTPGLDVAGRVVAVGPDVTRFRVGDEVFGIANGSLAEYATADEDKVTHKPANVTFEQAATAAVSGITALQALTDIGRIEPGQHVLIVGASGGVGSFAVQLAKALGAEVTAVASTDNLELTRTLGADHVIDYTQQDFTDVEQRYDLVLDIGGRSSISRLRSVLTQTGTLVIVGGEDGNRLTGGIGRQLRAMMLSPFVSHRLTTFISKEHYSYMERLAKYMQSGVVVSAVQGRFDLADSAEAIGQIETGQASGKSVIVVRPEEAR